MARTNQQAKSGSSALLAALRKKMYQRCEMDIGGERWEFWIKKLSPGVYMELFGSVFTDLRVTEEGYTPDTPAEFARQYAVVDKVILAAVVADDENGEPTDKPLFDEEVLAAILPDEKAALSTEILTWSGVTKENKQTARRFRKKATNKPAAGAARK